MGSESKPSRIRVESESNPRLGVLLGFDSDRPSPSFILRFVFVVRRGFVLVFEETSFSARVLFASSQMLMLMLSSASLLAFWVKRRKAKSARVRAHMLK